MQYEVTFEDPRSLVDYPLNAKKHTEAQIQALAKEIGDVGFRVPIVIDHDGVIISGHGRKAAAILASLDAVPVHRLPAALALLALAATACGAQEPALPQAQDEAPRNTRQMPIPSDSKTPPFKDTAWSLKAASPDKLPECDADGEGRLAWVVSEKTAYACSEAAWHPLDLRGRDGKDGQSIVGERGLPGESTVGPQGQAGRDGISCSVEDTQGGARIRCGDTEAEIADGAAGAHGQAGITTTITEIQRSEDLPKVRDANGTLIGDLFYYDTSRNHFLAATPSGLRVRFTSLGGIPEWNVYYKTANCSDTPAVIAEPYFMESLFRVHDGHMVKTGAPVNESRAYRRRGFGMPCEVAPSVVTARFSALRSMTQEEAADVWSYGLAYVD